MLLEEATGSQATFPDLIELGELQLEDAEEMATAKTAFDFLDRQASQEVMPENLFQLPFQLQPDQQLQQPMFPGSQDPFLGGQVMNHSATQIDLTAMQTQIMPEHPFQLQPDQQLQQPMFPGSQDPFLGGQVMNPSATQIDPTAMQKQIIGPVCVGNWNSPTLGQCDLYAVPCGNSAKGVPGAVIIGFMNGQPIWVLREHQWFISQK